MRIDRRRILAGAGALSVTAQAGGLSTALAQPAVVTIAGRLMERGTRPRVVVAGGGWGGLSFARHMRFSSIMRCGTTA